MALREGFWILGVFFSLHPKPPCLGWEWANCSSCSLDIPCVAWPKDVGGHQHTLLTPNGKPRDVLKKKKIMVEVVAFDISSAFWPLNAKLENQKIQSLIQFLFTMLWYIMIYHAALFINPLLMDYQKPSAVLCMSALHFSQGRHRQREPANRCRLKLLVFKWQGALFPLTLSQINWASQVCLWEREGKNQNKRSHWSEDGSWGWLSSLASRSATQPSGTAGHLIPPILSR